MPRATRDALSPRALRRVEIAGLTVIGTAVTEAFLTQIKISFFAATIVALPVLLWQAWQFVAPGLYEHEKQYTRSFVLFGSVLFLAGAAFCYLIVLELGLAFLLSRYEAIQVMPMIRVGDYLSLVSRLVLAFGVMFELPVVAYFLARVGLIDHRFLIRQARYAVIAMTILRPWPFVATVSLLGTQIVFWTWAAFNYHPEKLPAAVGFQAALLALFVAYGGAHIARARRATNEDLIRLVLNAFLAAVAGYVLLDEDYHAWMGTLALGMAVIYAALATFAPNLLRPRNVVVVTSTPVPSATALPTEPPATVDRSACLIPPDPNPATPLAAYLCLEQTPAPPPWPPCSTGRSASPAATSCWCSPAAPCG